MIDLETAAKIGALIGAFIGVKTALENLTVMRHKKLKDDYELAKTFFGESPDDVGKQFIEERGFQALSGIQDITGVEARQLIRLDSTGALLRSYKQAKNFIRPELHGATIVFSYRQKYLKKQDRWLHQVFYAGAFMLCGLGAIVSVLLPVISDQIPKQNVSILLVGMLGYVVGGMLALREAEGMLKADELVKSQIISNALQCAD